MTVDISAAVAHPFSGVNEDMVAEAGPLRRGKVRDVIDLGDRLALVATDRLSAFDHVLGLVPCRGQVLTQLSAWWFDRLASTAPSHLLEVADPNVTIVRKCRPLPVEIVVRGWLTGSTSTALWTRYASGDRSVYGLDLPDGMAKNDALPGPVLTPTTKAAHGGDDPLTEAEIVADGLVSPHRWEEIRATALALFEQGGAIAAEAGLILVDTKYEFGIDPEGRLTLIDELHTPDSSRFWRADTVEARLADGLEPENLDKEVVRLGYSEAGYSGDGPPPPLGSELAARASEVYLQAFEALTGRELRPAAYPAGPRVAAAVFESARCGR